MSAYSHIATSQGAPAALNEFQKIITIIARILSAPNDTELANRLLLTSKKRIAGSLEGPQQYELNAFVCSTQFLSIPLTTNEMIVDQYPIANEITRPHGGDALFNVEGALLIEHKRLFGQNTPGSGNEAALAILKNLAASDAISAELREVIRNMK